MEDIPEEIDQAVFFTRRNNFNTWTKRRPQTGNALLWHAHLGHPGPQALEHLVNSSQGVHINISKKLRCIASIMFLDSRFSATRATAASGCFHAPPEIRV